MKTEFRVGDRVICVRRIPFVACGEYGTVCDINKSFDTIVDYIGVDWDKYNPALHTCSGNCEDGHGWYTTPSTISLIYEIEDDSDDGLLEFDLGDFYG